MTFYAHSVLLMPFVVWDACGQELSRSKVRLPSASLFLAGHSLLSHLEQYNQTYLDSIEYIVNGLGQRGIYTILDMHQGEHLQLLQTLHRAH